MSNLDQLKHKLSQIQTTIESVPKIDDIKSYEGYYLFYSFDLVNATQFKSRNPKNWVNVFRYFYNRLQEKVKEAAYFINSETTTPCIKLWKSIGDELVFYQRVHSPKDVFFAPVIAHKIVDSFSEWMKDSFNDNIEELNTVGLKATVWIAHLDSELSDKVKNVIVQLGIPNENENTSELTPDLPVDFLGPDIDLGFRLTKFTYKSRVVISADLAYFLHYYSSEIKYWNSEEEENNPIMIGYNVSERLKIISFEKLKGVWNERFYPIIWYCEDWAKFSSYEDHLESSLSKNLWENKTYNIDFLDKVFEEKRTRDRFKLMKTDIDALANKNELPIVFRKTSAEVHCAVMIINLDSEEILVVKRSENKTSLPNYWEFGCSQITNDSKLLAKLKSDYKKDFNLEVDFFSDTLEENLLNIYQIEKNDGFVITGFLLVAYTTNPEDLTLQPEKHSESSWISTESLESFRTEENKEVVDRFYENIDYVLANTISRVKSKVS